MLAAAMSDRSIKTRVVSFYSSLLVFIPVFHRIVDRISIVAIIFDHYYGVEFRNRGAPSRGTEISGREKFPGTLQGVRRNFLGGRLCWVTDGAVSRFFFCKSLRYLLRIYSKNRAVR